LFVPVVMLSDVGVGVTTLVLLSSSPHAAKAASAKIAIENLALRTAFISPPSVRYVRRRQLVIAVRETGSTRVG
jgi:hypothetical protein